MSTKRILHATPAKDLKQNAGENTKETAAEHLLKANKAMGKAWDLISRRKDQSA